MAKSTCRHIILENVLYSVRSYSSLPDKSYNSKRGALHTIQYAVHAVTMLTNFWPGNYKSQDRMEKLANIYAHMSVP